MSEGAATGRTWVARDGALILGFVVCVALVLARALDEAWISDDALITFRYLDNLAAGHGLVYNLGERLESFSSPLFLALLAPGHLLGASPFVSAQVLGVLATVAELALIFALHRDHGRWPVVAMLAGLLFASDRIVHVWATGGLETALYSALVFASFYCSARELRGGASIGQITGASVVHLLLASARPEGAVLFAIYLGAVVLGARTESPQLEIPLDARRRLAWARSVAIVAGGILVLLALRYAYYGQLLPHTYAAKLEGVPVGEFGRGYLQAFARREGFIGGPHPLAWVLVVAALLVSVFVARDEDEGEEAREDRRELARVALLGLVYVGLVAVLTGLEGGDYMTDFRFLRPIMGVLFASAAACVGHGLVARDGARARLVSLAAVTALLISHGVRARDPAPVFADAPAPAQHKQNNETSAAEAAEFRAALMLFAEPGDAILTDRTGYKGYGHELRTVDATGLTSPVIEGNFYLRPMWASATYRDRLPGHARWPKLDFMRAEGFALITPKLSSDGHEVPEISERSHRRYRRYRFLHVTLALDEAASGEGEFLRFFTTLSADELAARARARGLDLCWRAPMQERRCADEAAAPVHDDARAHADEPARPAGIEATRRAPARTASEAVAQYFGAMRAADCEWLRAATAGVQAERDAHLTCAELSAQLEHMAPVRLWAIEWERPARDEDERVVRARFFIEGKDRVKILRVRVRDGQWRVTRL